MVLWIIIIDLLHADISALHVSPLTVNQVSPLSSLLRHGIYTPIYSQYDKLFLYYG